MTGIKRPSSSRISFFYSNKVVKKLNEAFIGQEFSETFLYTQGDEERIILQRNLLIGLILSASLLVFLLFLPIVPTFAVIASIFLFFVIYYLKIVAIKTRLRKQSAALERTLPLLRLVIRFLLKIVDNECDIQKIFVNSLRYVSPVENGSQFNVLVKNMVLGMPVEKLLSEFESPSSKLNDFIQGCSDVKALPFLADDLETFAQYKVFLKTLESRLVILVAEAIFLPILASLVFAFQNMDVGIHVAFIAVHVVILKYFSQFLLNKDFSMLYSVGVLPDQSKQLLDDFISFLIILGGNLRYHAPEKAMMFSFTHISRRLAQLLGIYTRENFWATNFHDALEALSTTAKSPVIRLIFNLINKFTDYASIDLARFVVDIAIELKRQKEIEEEKISIINAERFKARILVVCLTLILSILSVLFPLLARGTSSGVLETFSAIPAGGTLSTLIFVVINLFYNYSSCFYLIKITGIQSAHKYAIIVSFLFLIINLVGFSFFNDLA